MVATLFFNGRLRISVPVWKLNTHTVWVSLMVTNEWGKPKLRHIKRHIVKHNVVVHGG